MGVYDLQVQEHLVIHSKADPMDDFTQFCLLVLQKPFECVHTRSNQCDITLFYQV